MSSVTGPLTIENSNEVSFLMAQVFSVFCSHGLKHHSKASWLAEAEGEKKTFIHESIYTRVLPEQPRIS